MVTKNGVRTTFFGAIVLLVRSFGKCAGNHLIVRVILSIWFLDQTEFSFTCPGFDCCFEFSSDRGCFCLFLPDELNGLMAPGIFRAFAGFVGFQSFFKVIRDAGIQTPVPASQDIHRPWLETSGHAW